MSDKETRSRLLSCLKSILLKSVAPTNELQAIANILVDETSNLHEKENTDQGASETLQGLINLTIELQTRYDVKCDKEWFVQLLETFKQMSGMAYRKKYFRYQMLE
jgi:hypothetical protein